MDMPYDSPTSAQRRAIFERVLARFADRGIILDDPLYRQLINAWIGGKIEMRDVADYWHGAHGAHRSRANDQEVEGDRSNDLLQRSREQGFLEPVDKPGDESVWVRAMSTAKKLRRHL